MVGRAQGIADPCGQFARRQQAVRLDHLALGVHPLRLDRVEPGALDRQLTDHQAYPLPARLDLPVMGADPGPDLLADVPGGVVPDQQQRRLAARRRRLAAPVEEDGRYRADRPAVEEAQPDLAQLGQQQPGAGQGLLVGVVLGDRLLDQPQRPVPVRPGVQGGGRQAAPPDLVLEAEEPVGVGRRPADQAVARPFFRSYAGSGLVIQRLARSQRTPSRSSVVRIVSPLTRAVVNPWLKASSAAKSSVHRLVGWPKSRGLRCSRARSRSAAAGVQAAWSVWTAQDCLVRAATPAAWKAWIALRTVCSSQLRLRASRGTRSPRALAPMI